MGSLSQWRHWWFAVMAIFLLAGGQAEQLSGTEVATMKAIFEMKDSIAQSVGWKAEEVEVSGVDKLDSMFGHATLYEFDLQIGKNVLPLRLAGDVNSWQVLEGGFEKGLVEEGQKLTPSLAPFQLAGPLELWIHDADNLRLSLPHDVEAGVLKKVMLADGAVVTVRGARELTLRQPIQLPLPLSSTTENGNPVFKLIELATELKRASSDAEKPLSLRIVGPTSLTASSINEPDSTENKLKVKRLAPGSVELRSRHERDSSTQVSFEAASNLPTTNDIWIWPLPSLNGSDPKLSGIEKLLKSILGSISEKKGPIRLLKAQAAAATFVKVQFELEKKVGDEMFSAKDWMEWRTKPSVTRLQFELTGKVESDKIVPLKVKQIEPVEVVDSFSSRLLTGNTTFSKAPILYRPPSPFSL
ncbi:hypothetical protein SUGI_0754790 [Cryptomeria japonica]|uniref:protein TUNICAMYCIN INDUCED 1 n=1 Tax=Cryptomeria japonica TaxID=3369 RepID=UPI002414CF82|nr:protein TUNICAMYCIN INDUCED 1 [Cryptomeria japonica]GLJ37218.1 hypothetical protein SUGI_0754790 [Cryptomeria japonica]